MATGIKWTDETLNPIVGCSKISAGCHHCYAEKMARRLAAMGHRQYMAVNSVNVATGKAVWEGWNGTTAFVPSELDKPLHFKKPKTFFLCSMGDLFHESVQFEWLDTIMEMICELHRHTFILLTKRPHRMHDYFESRAWLYPAACSNLILGVSVEDQATADERIPVLLPIPAAKKFISLEPMIGAVDLSRYLYGGLFPCPYEIGKFYQPLDAVILGGESGPGARPLQPAWVRVVRDQCEGAAVPFFFKQWSNAATEGRPWEYLAENGFPELDGRTHTELAWSVKK